MNIKKIDPIVLTEIVREIDAGTPIYRLMKKFGIGWTVIKRAYDRVKDFPMAGLPNHD